MTLSPEMDLGRRTAATGVLAPARGACPAGMHPPFSFRSCPKRKRAVHGPKEKGAKRAPVQWPSARDEGRRIGASADFARPSGTLSSSARSILPSRGGWCGGCRGGRRIDLLLFSLPLAVPRGIWCNGPMRASAPTGIPKAIASFVGADALVRPLVQGPHVRPGSA